MGIFGRRKYIGTEQFPKVVNTLAASFESLPEEYILGSLMQLKREGADISKLSRDIAPGSELEDLLKGFQLTCMIGIAWDYIKDSRDQLNFNKMLSSHLGAQEGSRPWNYRESMSTAKVTSKLCLALWRLMSIELSATRSHAKSFSFSSMEEPTS